MMTEGAEAEGLTAGEATSLVGESRTRRLISGIGTSLISRSLGALAPLITVPISLQLLGASGYGAWSAALSLTAFAAFADLGLGVGLMTRLSDALADNDTDRARAITAAGYFTVTAIVVVGLGILWASSLFLDWAVIIGAPAGDRGASLITLVTLSVFIVNTVVALITRVQYASSRIGYANMWQAVGSVLGIGATFAAAYVNLAAPLFVLAASAAPILVGLLNTIIYFSVGPGVDWRPRLANFHAHAVRELTGLGSRFLLIMVLMSASLSTDSWIVAHTTSVSVVPDFAIPARIFGLLGIIVSVLTVPLWPTNVEAMRRGDIQWVTRTTARMTVISVSVVVVLAAIGVIAGPFALTWWLQGRIKPDFTLLIGLALWAIVQAAAAPVFMVQNAAEVLRPQIIGYAILLLALPIKWWVSSTFGFTWIPIVATVAYCLTIWPASAIGYRRALQKVRATE